MPFKQEANQSLHHKVALYLRSEKRCKKMVNSQNWGNNRTFPTRTWCLDDLRVGISNLHWSTAFPHHQWPSSSHSCLLIPFFHKRSAHSTCKSLNQHHCLVSLNMEGLQMKRLVLSDIVECCPWSHSRQWWLTVRDSPTLSIYWWVQMGSTNAREETIMKHQVNMATHKFP